ncbi:MAG TPA: helix-turn-helix domain-containing protein [Candidatus Babeliales bacterium]|nr:helix-turn-helix domain-containing protein [Candidatus Babeliales bacterium]
MDYITISRKEINQIAILEKLKKNEITQVLAAQMLNLSTRQIRNKIKVYYEFGPEGLVHKRRGSIGNRSWDKEIRDQAMFIIKEHYSDFGPTLVLPKNGFAKKCLTGGQNLGQAGSPATGAIFMQKMLQFE